MGVIIILILQNPCEDWTGSSMLKPRYSACLAINSWLIHSVNTYWATRRSGHKGVWKHSLSLCSGSHCLEGETDINQSHTNNKNSLSLLLLLMREFPPFVDVPMLLLLSFFCDFSDVIQEGLIPKVSGLKVFHAHNGMKSRKALCSSVSFSTSERSCPQLLIVCSKLHSVWGRGTWSTGSPATVLRCYSKDALYWSDLPGVM